MNPAAEQHAVDRYWAVLPAAGSGSRFGATQPKQYLPLRGRTLIEHSLAPFLNCGWIDGVVVALAADDREFAKLSIAGHWKIHRAIGGANRADSVLAGLDAVAARTMADAKTSVLVHDAARPCITVDDLDRLRRESDPEHGGLLALPVADTLKRSQSQQAAQTVDRRELWRAQTPQLFELEKLRHAIREHREVTDEAGAMEAAGYRPKLVQGREANLKVTLPDDLALAEYWLSKQEHA